MEEFRQEAKSSPRNSAPQSIVARQSTMGCHDVDSIARCLCRNTPLSPGIARSLCSNITSRSVARSLCRNIPPSPAVARTAYRVLCSNTTASHGPFAETPHCHPPSRVPSTETPSRHPASRGHSIVTPHQMSGGDVLGAKVLYIEEQMSGRAQTSKRQQCYIWKAANAREGRCPRGRC